MTNARKIIVGVDSCGRPRRFVDERGKIYSRLTVLRLADRSKTKRGRHAKWICRCVCGTQTSVAGACLRNGQTTSCGCYKTEIIQAGTNRLPKNEAALRRAINKIRGGATKRNLAWELTDQQIRYLISSLCHYCGAAPSRLSKGSNGEFLWNGLDQKTPCAGYVFSNCVPCCFECNRMKLNIPYDKFIEKCRTIASRFEDIEPLQKQSEAMRKMR